MKEVVCVIIDVKGYMPDFLKGLAEGFKQAEKKEHD
jgi:hypothetical protein